MQPPAQDLVGRSVGEYEIVARLGSGGMGVVYEGHHPLIGKRVAVKVLKASLTGNPEQSGRFLAEARAVNTVRHRGIVDIFSFGQLEDGSQYFVMEYLEGFAFDRIIEERAPLPIAEALQWIEEVLEALGAAHHNNIIHRDIKPSNLFLVTSEHGRPYVKVLDFGIAKAIFSAGDATPETRDSVVLGTPNYMSPEQILGHPVTPSADLYAVGLVLFELLTARRPFVGDSPMRTMWLHAEEPPPLASSFNPSVPADVDEAINWALGKKPEDRPPNAEVFRAHLERIRLALDPQSARSSRASKSPSRATPHRSSATGGRARATEGGGSRNSQRLATDVAAGGRPRTVRPEAATRAVERSGAVRAGRATSSSRSAPRPAGLASAAVASLQKDPTEPRRVGRRGAVVAVAAFLLLAAGGVGTADQQEWIGWPNLFGGQEDPDQTRKEPDDRRPPPPPPPAPGLPILLRLEEPAQGQVYSGIGHVRGFALGPTGISTVELYVDSNLHGRAPYGGLRKEVGNVNLNYPSRNDSGFALPFNFSELSEGVHRFTVKAQDKSGARREVSAQFQVVHFDSPLMADASAMNLKQASFSGVGHELNVTHAQVYGKHYEFTLSWNPDTQSFAITRITSSGRPANDLGAAKRAVLVARSSPTADAAVGSLYSLRLTPTVNESIVLSLDEPATGGVYSGVSLIRGWAIGRSGIQKVEAYVDGSFVCDVPIGGLRPDVANTYPTYPDSNFSTFAMTQAWHRLEPGQHKLTINALENTGASAEVSATFTVVHFENPLMLDRNALSLDKATFHVGPANSVLIRGLLAENKPYDVRLTWLPSLQGFSITEITPRSNPLPGDGKPQPARGR